MIYSFNQNNSGGYYIEPAKHIIVKDAKDSKHAAEIALKAGMYLHGVAAGEDCSCCGDRWYGIDSEFDKIEDAIADALEFDFGDKSIPQYIIVEQYEKPTDATAIMTMASADYFQVGDDHFGISRKKGDWRVRGSNYYDDLDIEDTVLE